MAERESQIATTIEQSRRLINAGLDPKSADMYWHGAGATVSAEEDEYKLIAEPYSPLRKGIEIALRQDIEDRDKYGFNTTPEIDAKVYILSRLIPAWSLSKLWDLLSGTVLGGWFSIGSDKSEEIIERLVQIIENRYANHRDTAAAKKA